MDRIPGATGAADAARAAARETAPWVEKLARLGYAAKGAVYVLVGGLALSAAVGTGGETTDTSGALASLSGSTAGRIVLTLIAVGLLGYVLWGLVRAIRNPEREGTGHRIFFGVTAIIYGFLAVEATRLVLTGSLGAGAGGAGGDAAHWSAEVMGQPFGQWLLGAAGLSVGIYGLQQLVSGWRVDLDDQLALGRMAPEGRSWVVRAGRLGLAARGAVFAIIGYYLVRAAARSTPSEARGLDAVLSAMRDTPWLLAIIALGLLAYGLYTLVRARYRVIRPT